MKTQNDFKLSQILSYVQIKTGLDITSSSRAMDVALARALYFKLARELTTASLQAIGEKVNRHHATVIYGIENLSQYSISTSKDLQEIYNFLTRNADVMERTKDNLPSLERVGELESKINLLEMSYPDFYVQYLDMNDKDKEIFEYRVKPILYMMNCKHEIK